MVLLMSVNPGFGGQSFIPSALNKLADARALIDAYVANNPGREIRLEIDGDVKTDNIGAIAAAGADTFVAGSAIFGSKDYAATIRSEEHTSELQSLMRISYAVFCLKKKTYAKPYT